LLAFIGSVGKSAASKWIGASLDSHTVNPKCVFPGGYRSRPSPHPRHAISDLIAELAANRSVFLSGAAGPPARPLVHLSHRLSGGRCSLPETYRLTFQPGAKAMKTAIAYTRESTAQQGKSGLGLEHNWRPLERSAIAEGYKLRPGVRRGRNRQGRRRARSSATAIRGAEGGQAAQGSHHRGEARPIKPRRLI
jgi:hypothetical protein